MLKVTVTFNCPEATTEDEARKVVETLQNRFGGTTVYVPVVAPRGTVQDITFVSAQANEPATI